MSFMIPHSSEIYTPINFPKLPAERVKSPKLPPVLGDMRTAKSPPWEQVLWATPPAPDSNQVLIKGHFAEFGRITRARRRSTCRLQNPCGQRAPFQLCADGAGRSPPGPCRLGSRRRFGHALHWRAHTRGHARTHEGTRARTDGRRGRAPSASPSTWPNASLLLHL